MTQTDPYAELASAYERHLTTLRGHLREDLVRLRLVDHVSAHASILDVGGGGAREAIVWARDGHEVVLVDASADMLRRGAERLAAEPSDVRRRVRLLEGRAEDLAGLLDGERFPVVVCHGVLMYTDASEPIIASLATAVEPGGIVSLLTKNADALAMRPALEGRWEQALHALDTDRDVGGLGVITRGDAIGSLTASVERSGMRVRAWYGVRCFTDHLGDIPVDDVSYETIRGLELRAGSRDPYRGIGRLLHVVAERGRNVADRGESELTEHRSEA